jgi:hypothetical protein
MAAMNPVFDSDDRGQLCWRGHAPTDPTSSDAVTMVTGGS